ncbi:MAG: VWA domain-containing protein [Candidatus Obscuribacterales bacterium]|nr:VWA domain-containing protein [Steroidobacteraceae bacterium]
MLRSQGAVYVLMTMNDAVLHPSDRMSVFIDLFNNELSGTTDDVHIRVLRADGTTPELSKASGGGGLSAWVPATLGSAAAMTSNAASWTVELKLSAADLAASDLPQLFGFGVYSEDINNGNLGLWPANLGTGQSNTWANFKTRYPIEYSVILDYSGSMLSDSKWVSAKNATNYMVNAMAMLKNATYFTDKVGAATFSWPCSGAADTTAVIKALANLPAFPAGDYLGVIADPASNNCTPIGEGVNEAFAQLGTGVEETQRVALLLSDGLHNKPDSDLNLSELTYTPCGTAAWSPCNTSVVQINTVAFGEGDWSVDTDRLNDIKNYYVGAFGATFNITNDPNDLKESFISSLDELYQMNLVHSGASGDSFVVDPGNQKLIVISSWTTAANAVAFDVQLGGSTVACNSSAADTTVGFAMCSIDLPATGTWRAVVAGTNNPLASDRLFALVDLNLRARFGIDQVVHGTGMDIVLTADVKQAGLAVTNDAAHPVNVTVAVEKPDEGLGTFLSTTDPNTCKRIEPQLPRVVVDGNIVVIQSNTSTSTQPGTTVVGVTPSAATSGDPASAQFQLAAQLLAVCNKSGLNRSDSGLKMFDDATNGDVTANDGVYTLRYAVTQTEGTYRFRFNAAGTTAGSNAFTRTKRQAEYVRVNVSPEHTPLDTRVLAQSGTLVTMEYHVTPRDRFGGYLGPGKLDEVKFIVSGAQLLGGVRDYNNGIYAQIIRYDSKTDKPNVVPVVQDQPIVDCDCKLPQFSWLLIVFLVLLVLLLLWLLLRCRAAKR